MARIKSGPKSLETESGNEGVTDIESCHEAGADKKNSAIAERAYFKAEARGFEPGYEMEDWLTAEFEINQSYTNI